MLSKELKKRILFFVSICVILIGNFSLVEAAGKIYHPYPIIFVHGIAPGTWNSWDVTRNNLDKYFRISPLEYKYFQTKPKDYFPICDYRGQNDGDIPTIARTTLLTVVKDALSYYPAEVPESERKVIIVCHSMGGLVLRSFLYQFPEYKEKIDKVIFIGTPHLGAPAASATWSLIKIYNEILEPMVNDYAAFYSQNVGSRRTFAGGSSTLEVNGLIYDELSYEIQKYRDRIHSDFYGRSYGRTPDPDGIALGQLRLAGNVGYHKVFEKAYKNRKQNINIVLNIDGTKTFLGKSSQYLSNPNKYSVLVGVYQEGGWLPEAWWINKLRKTYEKNFIFPIFYNNLGLPEEQSVLNAIQRGDGVVTTVSQMGIGGFYATVDTHHVQETEQYQPILQTIDDKPQVERIRVIAKDATQNNLATPHYVIFKIKEYLLAEKKPKRYTII